MNIGRAASDWPRTFFTPRVFLSSCKYITALWKHINSMHADATLKPSFENLKPAIFLTFTIQSNTSV